ncbi:MAG: hypothetical protein C0626_12715 [Arcobacter sp.]|uniref:class I SAM-dependent methyltransferase n=1 Tax=uncultured Arcobacter sp. TaxID=165434 RepID=UPI000CAA6042|nr:class I SAM-dependent methyltransferase [uncultured Arcobacter sp.]PLY08704.1 MAG: hypothetical protein C0626_12715 [Arcobacter sp.]
MTIKEADIRPTILINYNREVLFYEDIEIFHKKFHNKLKYIDNCIACDSNLVYNSFTKDGFTFQKCPQCNTLFVNPRPDESQLKWWYSNSKHAQHSNEILQNTESKRIELYETRIKNFLNRVPTHINKILEFGCGNGISLQLLKKINPKLNLLGIDLTPASVESCKEKGIPCKLADINDFALDNNLSYDAVVSFEVIEHLVNPEFVLNSINTILKKDGFVYMSMPNYHSYDFLEIGEGYRNLFAPGHLNYFNPDSIKLLLKRCGFEDIQVFCDGVLDTSIVKNYNYMKKIKLSPFWENIYNNENESFLNEFQKLLSKYNLSGNMTVIARKK